MDISALLEVARKAAAPDADVALIGPAYTSLRRALVYQTMSVKQRQEGSRLLTLLKRKADRRD